MKDCYVRDAVDSDVHFIAEAIMQAEKSGTERNGLTGMLGMSDKELIPIMEEMLLSGVDGCEFSLSSFLVAESNNVPIGVCGGWLEGDNEGNNSSAFLKTNIMNYYLPQPNLDYMSSKATVLSGLGFDRKKGTYIIEYVYTSPEYRGKGVVSNLLQEHETKAVNCTNEMYIQVCHNNVSAIKAYLKFGFKEYLSLTTISDEAKLILPDVSKLVMKKNIKE